MGAAKQWPKVSHTVFLNEGEKSSGKISLERLYIFPGRFYKYLRFP
jgi:hypothetical protein